MGPKKNTQEDIADELMKLSQVVVRSDGKVRKGQFDSVPSISKGSEYEDWLWKFDIWAQMYLTKDVYTTDKDRRIAWLNALIRAATLGGFEEMITLLQLYDIEGVRCEGLLDKLGARFLRDAKLEQKQATSAFMKFSRGKRTLLEAVKDLRVVVLKCHKHNFRPDKNTLEAKYESLLHAEEMPLYKIYLKQDDTDDSDLEKCIKALEELAKDQDDTRPKAANTPNGHGSPPFAGIGTKGKAGRHRSGYMSGTSAPPQTNCTRCGKACPATKGQVKEKCFAHDKECRKCGKKGHFESMCRSKQKAKTALAAATVEPKKEEAPSGF